MTVRERPIVLPAADVRAILAEQRASVRVPVTAKTCTILGYAARLFWPHLLWNRGKTLVDSGPDPFGGSGYQYLHVASWNPADGAPPADDAHLTRYRVRPLFEPGDRAWVREAWMPFERTPIVRHDDKGSRVIGHIPGGIGYRADLDECGQVPITEGDTTVWRTVRERWRSAATMPRSASRLLLEITSARVEGQGEAWEWIYDFVRGEGRNAIAADL